MFPLLAQELDIPPQAPAAQRIPGALRLQSTVRPAVPALLLVALLLLVAPTEAVGTGVGASAALRRVFMFVCCLPYAYGEGGFAWLWGANDRQSCTDACSSVGLICVNEFSKINSQAAIQTAGEKPCSRGGAEDWAGNPSKDGDNLCFWQPSTKGTCGAGAPFEARLCSCQCAADTYSTSDLKPYPCTSCDAGKYTTGTGATACYQCLTGKKISSTGSSCAQCEAGKYTDAPDAATCKE